MYGDLTFTCMQTVNECFWSIYSDFFFLLVKGRDINRKSC